MRNRILINIVIIAGLYLCVGNAQKFLCQEAESGPSVVSAVIPVYPAVAVATGSQGLVTVVAVVRGDGTVKSVKVRSGPPIFTQLLKLVVSRWKFAPTKGSTTRSVQLSFIFKLMPAETKSEDLLPIYRPPYEVEVRERLPIVSKDVLIRKQ